MSKVVAIVPCRAGSQRIIGKNKKLLMDKPLWQWTVEQAKACDFIDEIIITTDDEDIIRGYIDLKEPDDKLKLIIRPQFLSTSESPMWAVVEHACLGYPLNTIVLLLQVTSPLRQPIDIMNAWRLFELNKKKIGVVSVYWEYPNHDMKINGSIYLHYLSTITHTKSFIHNGMCIYIMPYERSIDIDTIEDWNEVERVIYERSPDKY